MPIVTLSTNRAGFIIDKKIETKIEVPSDSHWTINDDNELEIETYVFAGIPVTNFETRHWETPDGLSTDGHTSGNIYEDCEFKVVFINKPMTYDSLGGGDRCPTFEIHTLANFNYCVDNPGQSQQLDQPLIIYPRNWGLAQLHLLVQWDKSKEFPYLVNNSCNRMLYGNKTLSLQGQTVKLRNNNEPHSSGELNWKNEIVKTSGTVNYNGIELYPSRWKWYANQEYFMDVVRGEIVPQSLVVFAHFDIDTPPVEQVWVVTKMNRFESTWESPVLQSVSDTNVHLNQEKAINIDYKGYGAYLTVYRFWGLIHNTDNWEKAYPYDISPDGLISDGGFGDIWKANCFGTLTINGKAADKENEYDAYKYEVECYGFGWSQTWWGGYLSPTRSVGLRHNFQTKQAVRLIYSQQATMTSDGLVIDIQNDLYRTVHRTLVHFTDFKIDGEPLAADIDDIWIWPETLVHNNWELVIPISKLKFLPEEGSEVTGKISFDFRDNNVMNSELPVGLRIGYTGGQLVPQVNFSYINKYDVLAEIVHTGWTISEMFFIYEHNGKKTIRQCSIKQGTTSKYELTPPLNCDYEVYVTIKNENTGEWGAKVFRITQKSEFAWKKTDAIVVNGQAKEVALVIHTKYNPLQVSSELSLNNISLYGKDYEDVYYGSVEPTALDIDSSTLNKSDGNLLDAIKKEGFCLVRDDQGELYNCAVKTIDYVKANREYTDVKLSLIEVNRDIDIVLPYR